MPGSEDPVPIDGLTKAALARSILVPLDGWIPGKSVPQAQSKEDRLTAMLESMKKQNETIKTQIRSLPPHPPLASSPTKASIERITQMNDSIITGLHTKYDPAKGKPRLENAPPLATLPPNEGQAKHPATQALQTLRELEVFEAQSQKIFQKYDRYLRHHTKPSLGQNNTSVQSLTSNERRASTGAPGTTATNLVRRGSLPATASSAAHTPLNQLPPGVPTGPRAEVRPDLPSAQSSIHKPGYSEGSRVQSNSASRRGEGAMMQGGTYDRSRDPRLQRR